MLIVWLRILSFETITGAFLKQIFGFISPYVNVGVYYNVIRDVFKSTRIWFVHTWRRVSLR